MGTDALLSVPIRAVRGLERWNVLVGFKPHIRDTGYEGIRCTDIESDAFQCTGQMVDKPQQKGFAVTVNFDHDKSAN